MTMRDYGSFDCERFAEHLMDHIEGDDDAATRARMEAHAAACAACRALLADVRRISHDAAELPTLTPSRDLWPEIAARIEAPVIAIPQLGALDAATRRSRRAMPAWLRPAAAAAALVIATASITYFATHRSPAGPQVASAPIAPTARDTMVTQPAPAQQLASAPDTQSSAATVAGPRPSASEPAASNPRAVAVVNHNEKKLSPEATYDIEIRRLREIVRQRRTQLDTATLNVIERNLKIIDDAIAQCRAALARDPNSAFLLDNLNGALDTKVQLLRTAAMLPART